MRFIAKCQNQVLTVKPTRRTIVDGVAVVTPGEHIKFDRGEYVTEDKKEIAFLQKHRLYGVAFVAAEEEKPVTKV